MDYIHLGRSGLRVSRLCLGTMNFGPLTAPADAHAIMDRAHELGINFFDTANRYGGATSPPGQVADNDQSHPGWTEEIIGDWFASGGGRRERTVLATKLYGAMGDWPNEDRLSALNIRRACDASLRRLQTDYIDLYQMHHIDRDTPWEEIWQAMEVLVAQGKILYVGSSNFAGWHHRAGQRRRGSARLLRPGQRAVHLQPDDPADRARGPARRDLLRRRRDPVVPAARRAARRRAQEGARRTPPPGGPGAGDASSATASRSRRTRTCAKRSARSRAASRWPGCCIRTASPDPSSARVRSASLRMHSAR